MYPLNPEMDILHIRIPSASYLCLLTCTTTSFPSILAVIMGSPRLQSVLRVTTSPVPSTSTDNPLSTHSHFTGTLSPSHFTTRSHERGSRSIVSDCLYGRDNPSVKMHVVCLVCIVWFVEVRFLGFFLFFVLLLG